MKQYELLGLPFICYVFAQMADDAEYEVDSVNGWKIENGQHSYAIKWTGHGYDYMTYV